MRRLAQADEGDESDEDNAGMAEDCKQGSTIGRST